ncbi:MULTISPECIES: glycosyltransferase family 4 protein [unclassified Nocardioides]|uniref:glycosyltransferase family 4 protein n=1 Tax=unclassified Nocardioides TaxID=2615069 RepID=UPI003014363E
MRVVFLTWRDSTHPDGGGSEVFVEEVARELHRRGHEVTIRCARSDGATAEADLDGVRLLRAGGRLTVYPRALGWLVRHRRRVDVVVDVINGLPFGAPLVRRRGVVGLVHHVHRRQWQIIYPDVRGRFGWFVERRLTPALYRRTPILTVSDASRDDLVAIGFDRAMLTVARNGVGGSPVDADRSPTPRISVLARLVPHKQVEHAFAVVERLLADYPDLHLDVIGDGWWRPDLEAALARHGVADHVTLHGHLPASTRDRLLAQSWLMLLPSVKEGWGLAVMEAAVQGTPTVAYREAGGVAEAVADGLTGELADDLDDLVARTSALLNDHDRRRAMGTRAVERSATFTWTATADVVEEVLRRTTPHDQIRTGRRS